MVAKHEHRAAILPKKNGTTINFLYKLEIEIKEGRKEGRKEGGKDSIRDTNQE